MVPDSEGSRDVGCACGQVPLALVRQDSQTVKMAESLSSRPGPGLVMFPPPPPPHAQLLPRPLCGRQEGNRTCGGLGHWAVSLESWKQRLITVTTKSFRWGESVRLPHRAAADFPGRGPRKQMEAL